MKIPETIKLQFDPTKSGKKVQEIFANKTATILWCAIRNGHIVDQHFNDKVLSVARAFNKKQPRLYNEFLEMAAPLSAMYGRATVWEGYLYTDTRIDHEFWGQVYMTICGKRFFEYVISEKEGK